MPWLRFAGMISLIVLVSCDADVQIESTRLSDESAADIPTTEYVPGGVPGRLKQAVGTG
jgi:hypothetical protein